jgi:hypothetical protein
VSANVYGKLKMLMQVLGVVIFRGAPRRIDRSVL